MKGTQVAVKSIKIPSLSKMIKRHGILLSLYSTPVTSNNPLQMKTYHIHASFNPVFSIMEQYPCLPTFTIRQAIKNNPTWFP